MDNDCLTGCPSPFIIRHLPLFLERYAISCDPGEGMAEYFIHETPTGREVSFDLVFTLDRFASRLHVAKFYPGLYRQEDCRYLSATCFYLLVNHFGQHFRLTDNYRIYLRTRLEVFSDFYALLRDFAFTINGNGIGDQVEAVSPYRPSNCDTSMIATITHPLEPALAS